MNKRKKKKFVKKYWNLEDLGTNSYREIKKMDRAFHEHCIYECRHKKHTDTIFEEIENVTKIFN